MIYKKSATSSFITITAEFVKEDNDYVYLKCGKYIRSNIVSWTILPSSKVDLKGLKDDA